MNTPSETSPRTGITLRWLIILLIGPVLLVALFYGEEDLRGARAWAKFKRAQAAEGQKVEAADFVPPPVADEQNFAMTPLLRALLDYVRTTNGIRWRDTNAWQHLTNIRIDLGPGGSTAPKPAELEFGKPVDLKAFADFYRGNTNYPQSAQSANDSEAVVTALNKFEPDLKELREAAASRPLSRFPIEYNYKPPSGILLPHLASVKGLSLVCDLRAAAELESHRSADALADLQLALRLSDSIRNEPFLIDHLVRISTLNLVVQGVREGLSRHAWSDLQLAELGTNLASIDLLSEYAHGMGGENAMHISGIDYMRSQGLRGSHFDAPDEFQPGSGSFRWMPSGWYYQNMVMLGEYSRDYLLPAIDASNRVVNPASGDLMLRSLSMQKLGPYNFFAKLMLPSLAQADQRTARAQTLLDETPVACAIERYRMQQKQLPDVLQALAPQFISKIPNDLFGGQPLRYKTNTNGGYLIYSIGWNEVDDGGVAAQTTGNTPRSNPNEGDWVWESPASAK
jgi:hypothetical protein